MEGDKTTISFVFVRKCEPLIRSQEKFNSLVNLATPGQDTGQDQGLLLLGHVGELVGPVLEQTATQIHLIRVHGQQGVVPGDGSTVTYKKIVKFSKLKNVLFNKNTIQES